MFKWNITIIDYCFLYFKYGYYSNVILLRNSKNKFQARRLDKTTKPRRGERAWRRAAVQQKYQRRNPNSANSRFPHDIGSPAFLAWLPHILKNFTATFLCILWQAGENSSKPPKTLRQLQNNTSCNKLLNLDLGCTMHNPYCNTYGIRSETMWCKNVRNRGNPTHPCCPPLPPLIPTLTYTPVPIPNQKNEDFGQPIPKKAAELTTGLTWQTAKRIKIHIPLWSKKWLCLVRHG